MPMQIFRGIQSEMTLWCSCSVLYWAISEKKDLRKICKLFSKNKVYIGFLQMIWQYSLSISPIQLCSF